MRKLIIIFFLLISIVAQATDYYVRTDGNNSNNGLANTSGGAFRNLWKACQVATSAGDNIYVAAGSYASEGTQSVLALGVDIIGAGMTTTIIECSYNSGSNALIKAETTNGAGNQSISGIRFDGNMTTYAAIDVNFRNNVLIHDNTFIDFVHHAVQFVGTAEPYTGGQIPWDNDPAEGSFPNHWATGNKFYNNIVTNCAIYSGAGSGNLRIGTQQGLQIYGNTITQIARAAGSNGYGIKYYGRGFNKGTKCYNNTITIAPQVSGGYNFALELWYEMDECEYYGNTIQGCIDLDACDKQGGAYASWFHDNIIGFPTQQDHQEFGFDIEAHQTGLIINNNIIKNVSTGINFSFIWPIGTHPGDSYYDDIHIYNNLIYGIGMNGSGWSDGGIYGIGWNSTRPQDDATNVYIYNNTIVASGNYHSGGSTPTLYMAGIRLSSEGLSGNNIQIKNNIVKGFSVGSYAAPIWLNSTVTGVINLKINNNIFNGNGNSNAPRGTGSIGTGYDATGNITSDPLFVSTTDFRLQTGSPAYHAGVYTGLQSTTDYAYNTWNNPPSIGAYESGAASAPVIITTSSITSILTNSATSGGNVTSGGNSNVTERGLCWGTLAGPTTAGTHLANGAGVGAFTVTMTGLTPATHYHVRAYAINASGVSYGSDMQFTTNSVPSVSGGYLITLPDGSIVVTADGHIITIEN